ncbi:R-spondin-2-like [Pecten maximus]|uniref:R-spondin-2-like n=1 Tax=Pecten maximus TaxID=6579 RepID=UPI00145835F5|nr:R-spondin-2-like [Pecten maximus]
MTCNMLLISVVGLALFQASRGFLAANESVITETSGGYGACPDHCKITPCASQVGCSLCENGYCLHYQKHGTSSIGVCLASCPSGFYCQQIRFSICRACKDTNCDTCNFLGKCTKCKSGFALSLSDGTCNGAAMTTEESTTTEAMTTAMASSTDMMTTMGQTMAASSDTTTNTMTSAKAAMSTTDSMTTTKMVSGPAPVVG